MKRYFTVFLLSFLILPMTGCGSGTVGSSPGPAATNQPQGVYSGTTSSGLTFECMILPNDTFYAIYGTTSGNVLTIEGMITGSGTSSDGQYTGTVTDYYYTGAIYTGSATASYSGTSISGSVSEAGTGTREFSGTVLSAPSFTYSTPASLSDITGTWTGTLFGDSVAVVSITSNGSVSGSSGGCTFSGTVAPDASGRNFFDFALTYGGSPCLLPNQAQSGIAVDYLLPDGVTRQLLAGVSSGSYGNVFLANKTASPTSGSPTFIQSSTFTSQSTVSNPASTYTASLQSSVTNGDLIAVAFWWNYAIGASIVSVKDSAGNVYRPILQAHSSYSNDWSAWIYAATNVTGTSNMAVTVTVSYPNADQMSMAILEYSNVSNLDVTSTNGGTSGMNVTSGSATTVHPNELILGVAVADVNVNAGSGYNSRFTSPYFCVEDKVVSSI